MWWWYIMIAYDSCWILLARVRKISTVSTVSWKRVQTRVCPNSNQGKQSCDPLVNHFVFSPCQVRIRIHWSIWRLELWVDRGIANHPTRVNSPCTLGRKQHLHHLGWLDTHRLLRSHTQTSMKCFWKSLFTKTDICCLLENKPWLQTDTRITFRTTYCVCVFLLPFAKIRCEVAFIN